jgi:hypothetical protein
MVLFPLVGVIPFIPGPSANTGSASIKERMLVMTIALNFFMGCSSFFDSSSAHVIVFPSAEAITQGIYTNIKIYNRLTKYCNSFNNSNLR